LPVGYEFQDKEGNVINTDTIKLVKKQPQYPKTYEECCKVMGIDHKNFLSIRNLCADDGEEVTTAYEKDVLDEFTYLWELKICRDAYWKIAGEQMGLGKPWEPPYGCEPVEIFCVHTYQNRITRVSDNSSYHHILAFPTAEMRDVFYENFKDLIEKCKTFL
jgi:hypothetical protein